MIDERFVILGAILSLIGQASYIRDTLMGKIKPNKVTWFLWAIIPAIAFFAEIQQGVGMASLMTFMVGFGPFLIFAASFVNRKAYWKISPLDIACAIISIFGIFLWLNSNNPDLAIALSVFADGVAGLPIFVKSFKAPETENYYAFLMAAISALLTILSIKTWNFAHYAFPVYIFLNCSILVLLIRFRLGKKLAAR